VHRHPIPRILAACALGAVVLLGCGGDDDAADAPDADDAASTEVATVPPTTVVSEPPAAVSETVVPEVTAAPVSEPPSTPLDEGGVEDDPPSEARRAIDGVAAPEASTVEALLALDRPVIAAHAGGDFAAPHSTMYAFTEAALAGVDVLEMDVMLTADDVLVVHHDATVDRITPGTGRVRDLTLAELQVLDAAHWFSGGVWVDTSLADDAYPWRGVRTGDVPPPEGYGPDDFRIETFRSVATAFPDHVLDVEIKVPPGDDGEPDLARAIDGARVLAEEIEALGRTGSVLVVSFDDQVLAAFRGFAPEVATSPGLDTLVAWYAGSAPEFAPQDVVFQAPPFFEGIEVLTVETIDRVHADGFEVWVWMDDTATQETAEFYRELVARGVDGLIVSWPAVAVEALAD
jgi:glycerophosphoryl diester phosphodiesterase